MKNITSLFTLCLFMLFSGCIGGNSNNKIDHLKEWLAKEPSQREPLTSLELATAPLTKHEAKTITALILADKQTRTLAQYEAQWDNRLLEYGDYKMPFFYQIFSNEPTNGRSLFISLHGGGGTTAEVNDQQYENQKHLYDTVMKNLEGVYLAPRAPNNAWGLWHQDHIDEFLNIIIQMATIKLNVNPNEVYLLGYSAGGDGVYQLAPRMADRWAAASMMAGHPNDASPLSLRNTPFALHMGALDGAYDRNKVAQEWDNQLNDLQSNDPGGYIHDVQIHEGKGHWMHLEDAVALPWMKAYERNSLPQKVVWKQDNRRHNYFYWVCMSQNITGNNDTIIVEYSKDHNEINIIENSCASVEFLLNDEMLDLDSPITVKYQGRVIGEESADRTMLDIYESIDAKGDAGLSFTSKIAVSNNNKISK